MAPLRKLRRDDVSRPLEIRAAIFDSWRLAASTQIVSYGQLWASWRIAAKYSPAKVYEAYWGQLGVAHCVYFSCLCLHALLDTLPLSGTVKSGIRKAATVHVELKETLSSIGGTSVTAWSPQQDE
jgi:hypothetical protein